MVQQPRIIHEYRSQGRFVRAGKFDHPMRLARGIGRATAFHGQRCRWAWNRLAFLACLLLATVHLPVATAAGSPLTYAPLPLESLQMTQARNQPLTHLLSDLLGRPVEMRLYPDHAALLEAVVGGELDFFELGPLPLALVRDRVPDVVPLASFREPSGEPFYRCVLAAPVDGLTSMDLASEVEPALTVALTRRQSTCGPMATFGLLHRHGVDPHGMMAAYVGGHDDVAVAVLREQFVLGGLKESVARRFEGLGLRVLAASEPLPGFVLAGVPARLAPAELEALRHRLLELDAAQLALLQNGAHGFAPVDPALGARIETMRAFSDPLLDRVRD